MSTTSALPEPIHAAPQAVTVKSFLYDMNLLQALRAGLIGAVAITIYMFVVPRAIGIPQMDIGITIGRLVEGNDDYGALYWIGWALWHMVNGIVYVLPFAVVVWCVRFVTTRLFGMWWQVDLLMGFVFGLVLLNVGPMWSIPMMLADTPEVQARGLTNPGFYMLDLNLGWLPALVDLGAHSLHGCLVGLLYKQRGA